MKFLHMVWEIFQPTWQKGLLAICLFIARFIFEIVLNRLSSLFLSHLTVWAVIASINAFFPDKLLNYLFLLPVGFVQLLEGNNIVIYPPTINSIVLETYGIVIAPFLSWYVIACSIFFFRKKYRK